MLSGEIALKITIIINEYAPSMLQMERSSRNVAQINPQLQYGVDLYLYLYNTGN